MQAYWMKLWKSDWIAWWWHTSILVNGARFYKVESIWVLLDGAGLCKVKRIELIYDLVEYKGPELGRIHELTEKTKVIWKQYGK